MRTKPWSTQTKGCLARTSSQALALPRTKHAGIGVRRFTIDRIAQLEFDEAAAWYEQQEPGLGFEFIEEVDRVLARIEASEKFVTAPVVILDRGVVRREFVRRFPYVVIFVETEDMRRVIMIRRGNVDPRRWKSRM